MTGRVRLLVDAALLRIAKRNPAEAARRREQIEQARGIFMSRSLDPQHEAIRQGHRILKQVEIQPSHQPIDLQLESLWKEIGAQLLAWGLAGRPNSAQLPESNALVTWLPCGYIGFYIPETRKAFAYLPQRAYSGRRLSKSSIAVAEFRRATLEALHIFAAQRLEAASITPQPKAQL